VTGYKPRWFTRPQTVTHPSSNPAVHGRESNSQPVDHKSVALAVIMAEPLRRIQHGARWPTTLDQANRLL